MNLKQVLVATLVAGFAAAPAYAANVDVDLSGATTGTLITGVGASFTESFSSSGPLSLVQTGTIDVAFWDPGVSPAANSLLPEPGNAGNLAVLLDSDADSITFTTGFWDSGSVSVDFLAADGSLVGTTSLALGSGYQVTTLSGFGDFRGVFFHDNNDPAGLRYEDFSYNSVSSSTVPEPATWALMIAAFCGLAIAYRRRVQGARA